jgi:hypothetical protein
MALGLPIVWTFDADGERGIFAGLVLGAFAMLVPTGIYLALPRRWGMSLFAVESILIWVLGIRDFTPPRLFSVFILWSLVELPMYGLELFGLLEAPGSPPPRLRTSTLMLAWLLLLGVAYVISYQYEAAPNTTSYSRVAWATALFFLPIPPVIVLRGILRRILRAGTPATRAPSPAG